MLLSRALVATPSSFVPPTRVRWFPILGLVFIATLINYLDRAVFSIARPLFTKDLGIEPIQRGWELTQQQGRLDRQVGAGMVDAESTQFVAQGLGIEIGRAHV